MASIGHIKYPNRAKTAAQAKKKAGKRRAKSPARATLLKEAELNRMRIKTDKMKRELDAMKRRLGRSK